MNIKSVTILENDVVLVEYDNESKEYKLTDLVDSWIQDNLSSGDCKKFNFVIKDKGGYFEINVLLYSLEGEEVLLDNIIIDEDFIKHS